MYKYIAFAVITLSIGCFAYAENTVTQSGTTATINPDMSVVQNNDISKVGLIYCDDDVIKGIPTNRVFSFTTWMDARPGERKDICTIFNNGGDKDVTIQIQLTEGRYKGVDRSIVCEAYQPDNSFEELFPKNTEKVITLASGSKTLKVFDIKVPKNTTGNIYGCITYISNAPVDVPTGQVFAIQVRKAGPITINVTGSVYQFGRWNDIKSTYTDNKAIILKVIIAILAFLIVMTIFQTNKKPEKNTKKK